jgi:type IV pilus modification protein PilV
MNAKPRHTATNKESGFTMVEILIALTVFAIGILGIASMQVWGIRGNASAIMHSQAATFAADRIEKLMMVDYDDLADGSETRGIYDIQWQISPANIPIRNTKTMTVTVNWTDRDMDKSNSFTCYKALQ